MAESSQKQTKAAKEEAEERQAQAVASATGTTPPPAPVEEPVSKEQAKRQEAAEEVAGQLGDLSFDQLARLRDAVSTALTHKGKEPAVAGPSLEEVSGTLPVNADATNDVGKDLSKIAKEADIEEEEIIGYAVRQARNAAGSPIGPQYLRVAKVDGTKVTTKLGS